MTTIIDNRSLGATGLTVTPIPVDGVMPQNGDRLCAPEILDFSPPFACLGPVSGTRAWATGPDINIFGLLIKKAKSPTVLIPDVLEPFFDVLRACVSNEFAIDPGAGETRDFVITITRSDVLAGHAHRRQAGNWHLHLPSDKAHRYAGIPATRTYLLANTFGTECYAGHRSAYPNSQIPQAAITTMAANTLCVMSSMTLHRSPVVYHTTRRTVFILSSRSTKADDPTYGETPLFGQLASSSDKASLLSEWRANESALLQPGAGPPQRRVRLADALIPVL